MPLSKITGMILCGGYGKRLHPLTQKIPKVLLEIKPGYTLLDHQLSLYQKAGVKRVALLAGYLAGSIERKYGGKWGGMRLEYVIERKPLGTLNAIRLGMKRIRDDVIVSNGDIVADVDLEKMWEEFERSKCEASILAVRMRSPYGILKIRGKRILSFSEKPPLPYYINGGFYCLRKTVLPMMERFKTGNIEHTVFPELAKRRKLACYIEDGNKFWISVDTTKDLEEVKKKYGK